jgi:hypothetical protein
VNELDHRSQLMVLPPLIAESTSHQQHQGRAHALATAIDDVLGNLANQNYVGMKAISNDCINGLHVGPDKGIKLFQGHDKCFLSNRGILGG